MSVSCKVGIEHGVQERLSGWVWWLGGWGGAGGGNGAGNGGSRKGACTATACTGGRETSQPLLKATLALRLRPWFSTREGAEQGLRANKMEIATHQEDVTDELGHALVNAVHVLASAGERVGRLDPRVGFDLIEVIDALQGTRDGRMHEQMEHGLLRGEIAGRVDGDAAEGHEELERKVDTPDGLVELLHSLGGAR